VLINSYAVGHWRAAHFLAGDRVPAVEGLHDLDQALRLLEPLGLRPDLSMRPIFPLEAGEVEKASAALPPGRRIAVHPGSGRTVFGEAKRWAPARYATLIEQLRGELGLVPILLEGPDEAGVAEEIDPPAGVHVVRLEGPLSEAAAVLAACEAYVGNDSGLAHLSAAVGTPPVTLFGPARPDELCPWGYRHLVVQTPAICAPCFRYPTRAVTPHVSCRPPYCINQIEQESVLEGVRLALGARLKSA
jgi:ADP-heptose:LPS heptosyltransferase